VLQAVAGLAALGSGVAGALLAAAVFYPLCRAGGMGLGDLKLMAAVGALGGFGLACASLVDSALAGGAVALVITLARGTAGPTLRRAARVPGVLAGALRARRPRRFPRAAAGEAIPYGVAIAAGTAAALWWHWPGW